MVSSDSARALHEAWNELRLVMAKKGGGGYGSTKSWVVVHMSLQNLDPFTFRGTERNRNGNARARDSPPSYEEHPFRFAEIPHEKSDQAKRSKAISRA